MSVPRKMGSDPARDYPKATRPEPVSAPPCFIEGCDKPARTGVLLRPDQGGGVTYRCDEHLTSFGTDSWKCGSDTVGGEG